MTAKATGRVGVTVCQRCGIDATCIEYKNKDCITVQFPDGKIRTNRKWSDFVIGKIAHTSTEDIRCKNEKKRIGISVKQNCGDVATCVAYQNANNCWFKMSSDGQIIKRRWTDFVSGKINTLSHSEKSRRASKNRIESQREQREGLTKKQHNGMKATCIEYRKSEDCDFRFENGLIVKNRKWADFDLGRLGTHAGSKEVTERNGATKLMKNGLSVTCVKYDYNNCVFRLPDGTELCTSWTSFTHGTVGNSLKNGGTFFGYRFGREKFEMNGEPFFATCDRSGKMTIMSLRMMQNDPLTD